MLSNAASSGSWYSLVVGSELEQGDILNDFPVWQPDPEVLDTLDIVSILANPGQPPLLPVSGTLQLVDVIILSQTCDLRPDKIETVLLAPHWPLIEAEESEAMKKRYSKVGGFRKALTRGEIKGYHALNACEIQGHAFEAKVVGFRQLFTAPLSYVARIAEMNGERVRLNVPYREALAKAVGDYISRVAYPVDLDVL